MKPVDITFDLEAFSFNYNTTEFDAAQTIWITISGYLKYFNPKKSVTVWCSSLRPLKQADSRFCLARYLW